VQQLVDALQRLRITLNLLLPRLPGALVDGQPGKHEAAPGALLSINVQD
jgi:hypothetical protein